MLNIRTVFIMLGLLFTSHWVNALSTEKATFAGGCFWCMEAAFESLDGVSDVVSGFTGGTLPNPTYKGNHKGHYEAVEVSYDPSVISYQALLKVFWKNIDPFDSKGQFCDKGESYLSAIFAHDKQQKQLAISSKKSVVQQLSSQTEFSGQHIVTPILLASKFYPVEEYHQNYYLKNKLRYTIYRKACGRDSRLRQIWGKADQNT